MTDHSLITYLLDGCYIHQRNNRDKRYGYAVYSGNMSLISAISNTQFKRHRDYLKGSERYTLNLNKVRQLHGKSLAKQLYKKHFNTIKNGNQSKQLNKGV